MSRTFLILIPTIIAILMRLKPFDLLLRTFNTLTHELSHALIAKIFRQKIQKIVLNRDFSGSCITKITNKKSMFFISIAGYTIPALIGYGLILSIPYDISKYLLYSIFIINIISLIFVVANSFGRIWTICFASLNLIFLIVPIFSPYYNHIIYIYACILLIENMLSTITLLYITLTAPKKAGDSSLLKKATKIPAIIWSLSFFCFSVFMLIISIDATTKLQAF